jgi:hypothetical protein
MSDIPNISINDLEILLNRYNIKTSFLATKTLNKLLKEINTGKCTLMTNKTSALIRVIHPIFVIIQREDNKILIKTKQFKASNQLTKCLYQPLIGNTYTSEVLGDEANTLIKEKTPFIEAYHIINAYLTKTTTHLLSCPYMETKVNGAIVLIKINTLDKDEYQTDEFNADGLLRLTTNWKFMSLDEIKKFNQLTFDMISEVLM